MKTIRSCGMAAAFMAAALLCGGCAGQAAQVPDDGVENTGSTDTVQTTEENGTAMSIEEIYQEIGEKVTLQSPVCMDEEFIVNYYGIDVSALEEYVFSMSEDAAQAETVIIIKVKDKDDMAGIAECLQTVMEEKKNEMENYIPEQFAIVEKSKVVEKDGYLWLVISEHADAITEIIESGLF